MSIYKNYLQKFECIGIFDERWRRNTSSRKPRSKTSENIVLRAYFVGLDSRYALYTFEKFPVL